jgi:hypothetical protein
MTHTQGQGKSIETVPKEAEALDLEDRLSNN